MDEGGPTSQGPWGWTPPNGEHPPPPPLPPTMPSGGAPLPAGGVSVRLRPMGIGEMLDAAIKLYRRQWKTLLGIAAFVIVPLEFLGAFLGRGSTASPFSLEEVPAEPAIGGGEIAGFLTVAILYLFVWPFVTAAVARATSEQYLGGSPTIEGTYRFALSRTHSVLWVSFLTFLVTGFGFLLLIVPGILFWIRFTFAPTIVIVEGLRGSKAMRRSWRLAKGHFWKIVGTVFLAGILSSIAGNIPEFILTAASFAVGPGGWVLRAIGSSIGSVITVPFSGLILVLLYYDLRIRKEGFDLALMAQEFSAGAAIQAPFGQQPPPGPGQQPPFGPGV